MWGQPARAVADRRHRLCSEARPRQSIRRSRDSLRAGALADAQAPSRGPTRTGTPRAAVRPRLLETETDVPGIGLDRRHSLLDRPGEDAAVALEGELDVLGGHGIAGVEPRPFPQDEI